MFFSIDNLIFPTSVGTEGHSILFFIFYFFLQPSIVLIPSHSLFHTAFEIIFRRETEVAACWRDVAFPVALAQDVVFVIVESRHFARHFSPAVAHCRDDTQEPKRCLDAKEEGNAELSLDKVGECA